MLRLATTERSSSISKLPHVVRSEGTGLAASHLPFTNASRSAQASTLVSRSAMANAEVGGNSIAVGAGDLSASAPAAGAGASFWHAASAAVTARDSSRTLGFMLTRDSGERGPRRGRHGSPFAGRPPTIAPGSTWKRVSEVTPAPGLERKK